MRLVKQQPDNTRSSAIAEGPRDALRQSKSSTAA